MNSNLITSGPIEPNQPRILGSGKKTPNKLEKVAKTIISSHEADAKSLSDRSISDESSEEDLDKEYARAMADYNSLKKKTKSVVLEEKTQNPYSRSPKLEGQKAFYKTIRPSTRVPNVRLDIGLAKRPKPLPKRPEIKTEQKESKPLPTPPTTKTTNPISVERSKSKSISTKIRNYFSKDFKWLEK